MSMKKVAQYGSVLTLALFLAIGGSIGGGMQSVAYAQDVTPIPTVETQVQTTRPVEDRNETPWGLVGLLGLAGLAGLRKQPEQQVTMRQEPERTTPGVGVYDNKKDVLVGITNLSAAQRAVSAMADIARCSTVFAVASRVLSTGTRQSDGGRTLHGLSAQHPGKYPRSYRSVYSHRERAPASGVRCRDCAYINR